jgi:Ca-activated chloride channel family protein
MMFLHPEFIYFMLPPVLVLFYFLLTQQEVHLKFFSDEVLGKLRVQSNKMTIKARNGLFLLMFLMIILSLAQPVIEGAKIKVKARSADIMVALDISDSMLAEDVYPNRVEFAKSKIIALLDEAKSERIGVMAFAKDAYLVSPLSFDHRAVKFLLKQMKPSYITEKGTDFVRLLDSAVRILGKNRKKYLLILSDGGDENSFDEAINLAKEHGIKIFMLGIGTRRGSPIKLQEGGFLVHNGQTVITRLNHAAAKLAVQTGGVYIESVVSSEDIRAMLLEIAKKTDKKKLKEEEVVRYIPLFMYPLGMAMLLLLIATSSMGGRRHVNVPGSVVAGFVMLVQSTCSEAGLMDFIQLDRARIAYESGDFNKSALLYSEYAKHSGSSEALYNQANALYKEGRYASAAEIYKRIHTSDPQLQFNVLHNLGNAYAKQGTKEKLEAAAVAYEMAIKINKDDKTYENLKMVKELLEKMKQQKKEQNRIARKNSFLKKSGLEGQKRRSFSSKGSTKSDNRVLPLKSSSDMMDRGKSFRQKKSDKRNEYKENGIGKFQRKSNLAESEMSDLEADKWIRMLNSKSQSHIYRLNPVQGGEKQNENSKPW